MKLLFVCILIGSAFCASAQISVQEKKGKYTVLSPTGKKLCTHVDSVIVLDTAYYSNFFVTVIDGNYAAWKCENNTELISVLKGDYSGMYITPFGGNELVLIDFFDNRYTVSFDGSISEPYGHPKNRLRGGKNNKGKFALCTTDSCITEYKYDYIYDIGNHLHSWYQAGTDAGAVVINEKGQRVFDQMMDFFYKSGFHDSVLIGRKGDLWSVIDLSGVFSLEPTQLLEPFSVFNFDGASFSNLHFAEAVFLENGKQGVINFYGNRLVAPIYDKVEPAASNYYDEDSELILGLTSYAVQMDSNKNEWILLDTNYVEKFQFLEEEFVNTYRDCAVFMTNNHLHVYSLITGEKTNFEKLGYPKEFMLYSNYSYGIGDQSGKIILPFEFRRIDEYLDVDSTMYYVGYMGNWDVCNLYDAQGRCLTEGLDLNYFGPVCNGVFGFFRAEKDNKMGIATLKEGQFELIVPIEYSDVSCFSLDEDKPLVTAKKQGQKYAIYRNGRIELLKED